MACVLLRCLHGRRGVRSSLPSGEGVERVGSTLMQGQLVSLMLCVKNGMRYLPEALTSVAKQTYRRFEVVVQDGGSTDGTLEYLHSVTWLPSIDIVSQPDGGLGEAYNRAILRCRGNIVGTIDADNVLEPDALERAVSFLAQRPELAAVYGGSNMLDQDGALLYPWMPAEFDLLRFLEVELVPPFGAAFFSRVVCGDELRFDESLKLSADFDLWLRISDKPIARMPFIVSGTRLSDASTTRQVGTYDQQIADKSAILSRYFAGLEPCALADAVRRRSLAGLHLWAAESIYDIEGRRTEQFERYLSTARDLDPGSPRVQRVGELAPTRPAPEAAPAKPDTGSDHEGEDVRSGRKIVAAAARRVGLARD